MEEVDKDDELWTRQGALTTTTGGSEQPKGLHLTTTSGGSEHKEHWLLQEAVNNINTMATVCDNTVKLSVPWSQPEDSVHLLRPETNVSQRSTGREGGGSARRQEISKNHMSARDQQS